MTRAQIDAAFAAIARWLYRNPTKLALAALALFVPLVAQLPKVTTDNSVESFFRSSDPDLQNFLAFRAQFGDDGIIAAVVSPPEVFESSFLEQLTAYHTALEAEVSHLDSVDSLVNARLTRGEGDELIVEDLLAEIPTTPEEMAALRARTLGSELYPNLYISEDGRHTALIIRTAAFREGDADPLRSGFEEEGVTAEPLTAPEVAQAIADVRAVTARFESDAFPVVITGDPVVEAWFNVAVESDVGAFTLLSFLMFALLLYVLFRRVSAAVLPLSVVLLNLLASAGLMGATGTPFTSITTILPSLMIAVGVGASVHLLSALFRHFDTHGDKEAAVVHALAHTGFPILMTGVTTAVGMGSFAAARLAPVAHLGVFGAIGVLLTVATTLLLLPALLALTPLRRRAAKASHGSGERIQRILATVADFSVRHARAVVASSALIVVLAGCGLAFQRVAHNLVDWLPPDSEVRQGVELVDRELRGASAMEIVIDTRVENGLYAPDVLRRVEALGEFAEAQTDGRGEPIVGKVLSVVDVVKEVHRALNRNDPAYYTLPGSRDLIAQELLLFENSGSEDLEDLVDPQLRQARLTAKLRNDDAATYVDFVESVEAEAARLFGSDADVTVTGHQKLFTQTVHLTILSLIDSYTIAAIVISLLMIVVLGSVRTGLLSMIPNLAPILVTLGAMGWLGIPLDISNMLLGTVAMGIAVDDTIHFFHNFRRFHAETGDAAEAVRRTMLATGRALVATTIVLVLGFWLFMLSPLVNLMQFGLLIGTTLILALLGDLFVAPAMLVLITRAKGGAAGDTPAVPVEPRGTSEQVDAAAATARR